MSSVAGLADLDVEAALAAQQESFARAEEAAEAEAADPLGRHRWVLLEGLQTTALNGKYAEIVVPANENDRLGVRVQGAASVKLIKRNNLVPIADEETVRVCRLASKGETQFIGGYIQDVRWPLAMLDAMPFTTSAVSACLGFPLRLTRVQPRSALTDRAHFDNQWATYMAIDPESGFAPPSWQSHVGPCVVWRPDGDTSSDDMCLLNDFISDLLNGPYDSGELVPGRDLTPQAWERAKTRILDNRRLNPHVQQYKDVNI